MHDALLKAGFARSTHTFPNFCLFALYMLGFENIRKLLEHVNRKISI